MIRSTRATSGWSARGGQGKNPYALDRSPIGSSSGSGIGIAADLCTFAMGTETDGSIVCPASAMSLVGLKPTVGLISRVGLIPISHTQDTAGPMGRTVEDVATVLNALTAQDPDDLAMKAPGRKVAEDYVKGLNEKDFVKGKRIGVVRALFGKGPHVQKLLEAALKDLTTLGAVLVDVELPALEGGEYEIEMMLYELKADLDEYLKKRRPDAQVKNLADIIAFNEKNAEREMPFFAQELFVRAQAKGPLTSGDYKKALDMCRKKGKGGIDTAIAKNKLDALVTGTMDPPWLIDPVLGDTPSGAFGTSPAAMAGYPSLSVPAGEVGGLPIGLLFFGPAWSEQLLLKLAWAYENATGHRKPPLYAATATPKF
jgi:amidase